MFDQLLKNFDGVTLVAGIIWLVRLEALTKDTSKRLKEHIVWDDKIHFAIDARTEKLNTELTNILERLAKIETIGSMILEKIHK